MGWCKNSCDQNVGELRTSFWVLFVLRTAVLKQVVLVGKYGLEYDDFVVCQCWTWADMLNCVYHSGSEHEDPDLFVVA